MNTVACVARNRGCHYLQKPKWFNQIFTELITLRTCRAWCWWYIYWTDRDWPRVLNPIHLFWKWMSNHNLSADRFDEVSRYFHPGSVLVNDCTFMIMHKIRMQCFSESRHFNPSAMGTLLFIAITFSSMLRLVLNLDMGIMFSLFEDYSMITFIFRTLRFYWSC